MSGSFGCTARRRGAAWSASDAPVAKGAAPPLSIAICGLFCGLGLESVAQESKVPSEPNDRKEHRMELIEAMRAVQSDCASDANRTEGMALTGRNVGELFGSTLAMIATVARAVELLAEREKS